MWDENMVSEIKTKLNIVDLAIDLGCDVNSSDMTYTIYKDENNPSLKLYRDTNTFHCFSTDESGDIINFYADKNGIRQSAAIEEIYVKYIYGKKLKNQKIKVSLERENELLNSEKEFYNNKIDEYRNKYDISKAKEKSWADILQRRKSIQKDVYRTFQSVCEIGASDEWLDYLVGVERGLNKETINKFELFTITDINETLQFLKDSHTMDELIIAGLYNRNNKFLFSRHTILIPYFENDEIVYIRGRYFYNGKSKSPLKGVNKYIAPHNFSKTLAAKRFFNWDIIKSIQQNDKLIICEGEFDTMITVQYGYNAIGIPGINNFPEKLVDKLNDSEIYLAFDNDEAGEKATLKISSLFTKQIYSIDLINYNDLTEVFINAK